MNQPDNPKEPFYSVEAPEVRSAQGGPTTVFGYYAVFNQRSQEMRTRSGIRFVEVILPGAFDDCDDSDVECRFNHTVFLAASPTLQLGVDERGAWYSYQHDPGDPDHVSALRKIQRGEVQGSSFEFDPPDKEDQIVEKEADIVVRSIKRIRKKWDVGPVIKPAYRQTTAFARSLDGAYAAELDPTPAQKEAGNYKKGRVRVAGMEISIENPKGAIRSGVDGDGNAWESEMSAHYGYILGSVAGDGDHLDVFLSDDAESAPVVFVVDQIRADGTFDEHKVVIGPGTEGAARELYLRHYPAGWTGLGAVSSVPMECFCAWAMDGKMKDRALRYVQEGPPTAGESEEERRMVQRRIEVRRLRALHP